MVYSLPGSSKTTRVDIFGLLLAIYAHTNPRESMWRTHNITELANMQHTCVTRKHVRTLQFVPNLIALLVKQTHLCKTGINIYYT